MRNLKKHSEIGRLAAPLARLADGAWQRMHWWVITMAVLYALSGITVVRPDETAVVLRWGKLVGATPALQQHGPGLLFALPRPIDQVVRVQVKHVWEVPIETLANNVDEEDDENEENTLDPLQVGYALTGDQNIVHVNMVARYRVRDPAEFAFSGPNAEDVLRAEVTSAMVCSLGEMGVDRVLSDGRKDLIATASRRAQAGLDAAHSGLELTSLELVGLSPPQALAGDFDDVQSAYINAETKRKDAQAFAEAAIPGAQADADAQLQMARGQADADLANAKGETSAFLALDKEYRASPVVVRERLYRDAVNQALSSAGQLRWIPPPTGRSYNGFRVTLQSQPAANPPAAPAAAAAPTGAPAPTGGAVPAGGSPVPPPPAAREDDDQ